ncbi:MAG: DUF58 domain-containing protein [Planctomycetes bacterium]|nr:DUF58 domain-containing protein [Planctomycetota bacterium]
MPPLRRPNPPNRSPDPAADSLGALLAEVRRIEVQSHRLVTDVLAGGYRSTFRGHGVEFAEVREWVEGDDLRTVDWNVTARAGRPFVKRFVEEREHTLVFVLDLSASMEGGLGAWSLRQTAARFCACLGLAAIDNDDRIGLVAGSDGVERFVPPRKGAQHALRIVRDCLLLRGRAAGTDLGALVAHASRALRRRSVLFVLSDFVAGGGEHELRLGNRRHDLVAVRLVPREHTAPPPDLLRVRDPETGREGVVDFGHRRVRADWLARCRQRRAGQDEWFARAGIDCIDLEVPGSADLGAIARPLRAFFHRRERREAKR